MTLAIETNVLRHALVIRESVRGADTTERSKRSDSVPTKL